MIKKSFILLTLLAFFSVNFSFAQQSSGTDNAGSTAVSGFFSEPSMDGIEGYEAGENLSDGDSESGTAWEVFKMILTLALVVAIIYGVAYFFKKGLKQKNNEDPFLRQVSKVTLSPGKSVQIVTLLDKAYIIGVTDDNINLLGEVEDKELINSMNLYSDKNENTVKPKTFADILNIFMPDSSKKSGGIFSGNKKDSSDFLRRQRDRLNGEE